MNKKANTDSAPVIGVLLNNLGTPDSPGVSDVRRYLKEFLSDRRVVNTPKIIWWPILNFVILNTRPKRSAAAYAKIWTDEGSPLLTISQQQASALQAALDYEKQSFQVKLAMRYGKPSIAEALRAFKAQGVERIIVLPLYPQFSDTTTSSSSDAIELALASQPGPSPTIEFIKQYYDEPDYIEALANSVRRHWEEQGRADKLVMSFHGIPQDYADAGDPYPVQCQQTAALLAKALNLESSEWQLTFQSRLGPKQWLQPYTDKSLQELAQSGVKNVQIMCPGFSADCLETLEEIQMENREVFREAGGENYHYIPCLNAEAEHIQMMVSLILRQLVGEG